MARAQHSVREDVQRFAFAPRRPLDAHFQRVIVDVGSENIVPVLRDVTAHQNRLIEAAPAGASWFTVFVRWLVERRHDPMLMHPLINALRSYACLFPADTTGRIRLSMQAGQDGRGR